MKISTVREFRDKASGLLRSKDPILVTRRGLDAPAQNIESSLEAIEEKSQE
jgi:hypothetical protein